MMDPVALLQAELGPLAREAAHGSPKSPRVIERLLQRARQLDYQPLIALARVTLGHAWQHVGKFRQAQRAFLQGADLYRQLGDEHARVEAMVELGRSHYACGDAARALDIWSRTLELARANHDMRNCARICLGVGQLYVAQGDHPRSLRYHELALRLARPLGDDHLVCEALLNVAGDAYRCAIFDRAMAVLDEAEQLLAGPVHNRVWSAEVINYRGLVHHARGDYVTALAELDVAFTLHDNNRNLWGRAHSLLALGRTHLQLGDTASGQRCLEAALEMGQQSQIAPLVVQSAELLAELASQQNEHYQALAYLRLIDALESRPGANPAGSRPTPAQLQRLQQLEADSRARVLQRQLQPLRMPAWSS
ncbi:tetratricopeptide repeat protein [Chitinilyticum aquatile]|uniref:tetratricopeptide repeat protein n=1 Tax=Chitinilyticum aquatile TaxID=362520 RepID=UPI00041A6073|nr:tetratricopeptide repeat protein [Chitinilyticum aquatile]